MSSDIDMPAVDTVNSGGTPPPMTGTRSPQELLQHIAALQDEAVILRGRLRLAATTERALRVELQHRVRNVLGIIHSILRVRHDDSTSMEDFAQHLDGRLSAIARYQLDWNGLSFGGVEIEDIVRDELLEVGCVDEDACSISGPVVLLSHRMVGLVSLAIHELATNSIKFGALAHGGRLRVEWSLEGFPAQPNMHLKWIETGVPMIAVAPRTYGFGRQLVEEALPYQLNATTSFDLMPGGLSCSLTLPLPNPDTPATVDSSGAADSSGSECP